MKAWMRVIVPGRVISVSPRVEKILFPSALWYTSNVIETIVVNILTRFAASLPSDVHLAFNCLHGCAARRFLTLFRASLNVNTNTDLDVCILWESRTDTESTFWHFNMFNIISLRYSIAPIKLSFSAGNIYQSIHFKCQDKDLIWRTLWFCLSQLLFRHLLAFGGNTQWENFHFILVLFLPFQF